MGSGSGVELDLATGGPQLASGLVVLVVCVAILHLASGLAHEARRWFLDWNWHRRRTLVRSRCCSADGRWARSREAARRGVCPRDAAAVQPCAQLMWSQRVPVVMLIILVGVTDSWVGRIACPCAPAFAGGKAHGHKRAEVIVSGLPFAAGPCWALREDFFVQIDSDTDAAQFKTHGIEGGSGCTWVAKGFSSTCRDRCTSTHGAGTGKSRGGSPTMVPHSGV